MKKTLMMKIPVQRPFNLDYMVLSHGWSDLLPYHWNRDALCLDTVVRTQGDRAFALRIESEKDNRKGQKLKVHKLAGPRTGKKDLALLEERLRWSFRLDDDFAPFQKKCARISHLKWVHTFGLGPFLRNSDLFEEFAKILITTNINWAGTRNLNRNLLEFLGQPVGGKTRRAAPFIAFPSAEAVASKNERFLREKVRLGYRAPFMLELARAFAEGRVDRAFFLDPGRPIEELAGAFGKFKGFGPYAVNSLLITFGRFEEVIVDSWIRKMVSRRHFKGRKIADSRIRKLYAPWGPWAGLACWFECAHDTWFEQELKGKREGVHT
ncbi:MAG: DNA-3-methyladenine glycosylase family protein [Planctomycetota bacterium]|jgi:3-methyladenine DNA glycosylase/8-oxoguanine DNA glycosylase